MTIFLGTVGGRIQKSEFLTAIMGSQFGHHPPATDYGPIVIDIELLENFCACFQIVGASFMQVSWEYNNFSGHSGW